MTRENIRFGVIVAITIGMVAGALLLLRGGPPGPPPPPPELLNDPSVAHPSRPVEVSPTSEDSDAAAVPAAGAPPLGAESLVPYGRAVVVGRVVDEAGAPVPGAKVAISSSAGRGPSSGTARSGLFRKEVEADSSGEFECGGLQYGYYAVGALGTETVAMESVLLSSRMASADITLRLEPAGSVSGIVETDGGSPVAGASVTMRFALFGSRLLQGTGGQLRETDLAHYVECPVRVVSDAEGRFVLSAVPRDSGFVVAKAEGFALGVAGPVAEDAAEVRITMSRGGGISGRVVDAATEQPIPNERVLARSPFESVPYEVVADGEGRFLFERLRPGDYGLAHTSTRYASVLDHEVRAEVKEGEETDGIEIRLGPATVVKGRVYDALSGRGLENLGVRCYASDGRQDSQCEAETDRSGAYVLEGLGAGEYEVQILADGLVRGPDGRRDLRQSLVVRMGDTIEGVDFPVSTGILLRGRVVDTEGRPVRNASVTARSSNGMDLKRVHSAEDGRFSSPGFEPNSDVIVQAQKGSLVSAETDPISLPGSGTSEEVDIVLRKGASVSGKVILPAGAPLEGVLVRVLGQRATMDATDRDGRFFAAGLPAGTHVVMAFTARGEEGPQETVELTEGEQRTGLQLVWKGPPPSTAGQRQRSEGTLSITGRVLDKKGRGIAGAWVRIVSGDPPSHASAMCDPDGSYELGGLPAGTLTLQTYAEKYVRGRRENVRSGSTGVDFVLESQGTVAGIVVAEATGEPFSEFEVGLMGADRVDQARWMDQVSWRRVFDAEGRFEIAALDKSREMVVAARAKGCAPGIARVGVVPPGQSVEGIVVRLQAGARVEGTVVDARGTPISRAAVSLAEAGEPSDRVLARSDKAGRFSITGLGAGNVFLRAKHPNYASGDAPVSLKMGRTERVEIVLNYGGIIEGTVLYAGKAVGGQRLHMRMHESTQSTRTGSDGRYSFRQLKSGEARVSADLRVPAESGVQTVRSERTALVAEGQVTVVDFDLADASASIEGNVTIDGAPATSGRVAVMVASSTGDHSLSTHIEGDGSYRLDNIPAGAATLNVSAHGSDRAFRKKALSFEVRAGAALRKDIEFLPIAMIRGVLGGVEAGEQAYVAVLSGEVIIKNPTIDDIRRLSMDVVNQASVSEDGAFAVNNVEAGTYTVIGIAFTGAPRDEADFIANMRHVSKVVEVKSGEDMDIDLNF